jgi:hypothetical protein
LTGPDNIIAHIAQSNRSTFMNTETRELTSDELGQVSGGNARTTTAFILGGIVIYEGDTLTGSIAQGIKEGVNKATS